MPDDFYWHDALACSEQQANRASQPIPGLLLGGGDTVAWPLVCPFSLAELLPAGNGCPDIDALAAKLHA